MTNLYFITGVAGTGKSTILRLLSERGFYCLDLGKVEGAKNFFLIEMGEQIYDLETVEDWVNNVNIEWNIPAILSHIPDNDKTKFIADYNPGQKEIYSICEGSVTLITDNDERINRLEQRTEGYGTTESQREHSRINSAEHEKKLLEDCDFSVDTSLLTPSQTMNKILKNFSIE